MTTTTSQQSQIDRFAEDLRQEIVSRVEGAEFGGFFTNAFTEVFLEYLQEKAGEFEDATVCPHQSTGARGAILQMHGYGISENGEDLDLIFSVYRPDIPTGRLNSAEVENAFNRLRRLYSAAVNGGHQDLPEGCESWDAFQTIWHAVRIEKTLLRIRFVLFTNAIVPDTIRRPAAEDRETIRFDSDIWDIERLYRLVSSGREREAIEIDFEKTLGDSIPCLMQPDAGAEGAESNYAAYLAIFPGKALANLYGQYGARLLERNVRSFLQARGNVNKGIRGTILNEPYMFLAYNNGLAITAESVETVARPDGGLGIRSIRDLQIVNGGQTTASIFYSSKRDRRADISRVFVQAKITVLSDLSRMDEIVPLISRYANSQNKIQDADLVANDAFHRRIEELSRSIWAPAASGTVRQTRWFYERARGQYTDAIDRAGTLAQQRAFQSAHPKAQLFTKLDLAKFQLTWEMRPDLVSRGGQKCLNAFMEPKHLEDHFKQEGDRDTAYFERLIARAIVFRVLEKLVTKEREQYPAYRANLVTFAIARLVHETDGRLDLGRIWREQAVPADLQRALMDIVKTVYGYITERNEGGNVTEFCKKKSTWDKFLAGEHVYTDGGFARFKVSPVVRPGGHTASTSRAYEIQEIIRRATAPSKEVWLGIADWGLSSGQLSRLDCTIAATMATRASGGTLSVRQADTAVKILDTAARAGYPGLEEG